MEFHYFGEVDPRQRLDLAIYADELIIQRRVKEGYCPNGCAPLLRVGLTRAECPHCGFEWVNVRDSVLECLEVVLK